MPKLTKITLKSTSGNTLKLCTTILADSRRTDHVNSIFLVTPAATLDQLRDDLEGLLVTEPTISTAVLDHQANTVYESEPAVAALLHAIFLWLTVSIASKALKTRFTKGLQKHEAPQLFASIMSALRIPMRSLYKRVREDFKTYNPTASATSTWRWNDVNQCVHALTDMENRAIEANRAFPDQDLYDKLLEALENVQTFAFCVGEIRASDNHTFAFACDLVLQRIEDLRDDVAALPAQVTSYHTSQVCSHCESSTHQSTQCWKKHPHLRANVPCRNHQRGAACAQQPCPFKHQQQPQPQKHAANLAVSLDAVHGASRGATYAFTAFEASRLSSPPGRDFFDTAPAPAPAPASTPVPATAREPPRYRAMHAHTAAATAGTTTTNANATMRAAAHQYYEAAYNKLEHLGVQAKAIMTQPTFMLGCCGLSVASGVLGLALIMTGHH
jgi:hypothetical protein